ncbi:CLN3_protein [Hexamita inflata]|uniref:CLN3_protein n=1 Tax=Hexamita inflata TaxID=28002 RepID=A0ABP1JA78_9EUKA
MEPQINLICFLLIGFSNYFGFFLMLSAAKSMMKGIAATSTVLFCDILPKLLVKLIFPFIQDKIKDLAYVLMIVSLSIIGYVLASFSFDNVFLGLSGVVLTSTATGIGDVFVYGYTTRFSTKAIGHYLSGTGLASLGSSLLYAFLVDVLNCNPKYVIYSFLALPFLLLECFLLTSEYHSPGQQAESKVLSPTGYEILSEQSTAQPYTEAHSSNKCLDTTSATKEKFKALGKSSYMYASIFLAATGQYLINQSVNPVIEFPDSSMRGKYFTFSQVACNLGAFMGKTSSSFFKIPRIIMFIPVSIDLLSIVLYSFQAVDYFIKEFWLLLFCGVVYGFCAGMTMSHSFYWVSVEQKPATKKFALSGATLSSSFAVFVASILGFFYEDFLVDNKKW